MSYVSSYASLRVTSGIFINWLLVNVNNDSNQVYAIVANPPSNVPPKVASNDSIQMTVWLSDNGFLYNKYRTAGYSSPSAETLTMEVDVETSSVVVSEYVNTVGTLYPWQMSTWQFRFTMPSVYKNQAFNNFWIGIWSGRSTIVTGNIFLKHITLSSMQVKTDKSTYMQGEIVNCNVVAYDQDGVEIDSTHKYPLYMRLIDTGNNNSIVFNQFVNNAYTNKSNIQISTSSLTPDKSYRLEASERRDYSTIATLL